MAKYENFQFGTRPFRNLTIGVTCLFIILSTWLTLTTLQHNKKELLKGVNSSLKTVLNTTTEGITIWMADKKFFIHQLAKNDFLVNSVERLRNIDPTPQSLLAAKELGEIRHFLNKNQIQDENTGFFIINSDNISILSMRNNNVGNNNFIANVRPDLLKRAFQGETVFVPPIRSDIHLGESSASSGLPPTIFFITPITNSENKVIAALAMRLDADKHFSRVIQLGRIGQSGETYAFNKQGKLLSESRFTNQLREIGFIDKNEETILNISITDPGYNLLTANSHDIARDNLPYTLMAASAIKGESGQNTQGYRDYRGIPVYGVWQWNKELGLGLTTEIDVDEALGPYILLRSTILSVLASVIFAAGFGIIFTLVFGERAYRLMRANQDSLEEKINQRTSELQRSERSLLKALAVSETATRTKSTFLANMSHEIRTPMNAVIGFTDIILQTDLSKIQRKHLTTVSQSAKSLLALLNDILDISKLEDGKMQLEEVSFMLPRLIEEVLSTLSIKTKEKNLSIHLDYDETLSNCFSGDPTRLKQVIMNLVGNAIKFTPKGKVTLKIEPDKIFGFLHFQIIDTGIGIPEDRLYSIFSPFTQGDTSTTRKHGGTGLGTTISRQIVELMSGEIWVESQLGKGSTFHFTAKLPMSECTEVCAAGRGEEHVEFRAKRSLNILIAEDIPENVELVSIRLVSTGHKISVATNGLEAVQMICNQSADYDLVLMDIHMPEMDGLEATKEIRRINKKNTFQIPIIALSASVLKQEQNKCYDSGMNGFVSKPIDFFELFSEISRVVPKDAGKEITHLEIIADEKDGLLWRLNGVNIDKGLKAWRDTSRYIKSLISFANKHEQDDKRIKAAIDEQNYTSASELTHALKGVAGNLSIENVSLIASKINDQLKTEHRGFSALIEQLSKELNTVTQSINNLEQELNDSNTFPDKKDVNITQTIIADLLKAINHEDIDLIESLFGQINRNGNNPLITQASQQIENFDFSDAKKTVLKLASSLHIELK